MLYKTSSRSKYVKIEVKKCLAFANETAKGGGIQHFQIKPKFWHYTTNKFDL